MKYDVIVVGSGLGGLECASILSRSGLSVLVLEKGAQAGGCMQSYCRRGMWYDTGFHYVGGLGEGQSLYAPFRYLGLLDLPWKRLDFCFDRISVGGRNFVFAEGFDEFARMLAEDFPAERSALCEYASLLRHAGEERFLSPGMSAGEADLLSPMSGVGAYSYLSEKFRDPLLVDVLSGASLKMELRKESLPLFTFVHGNSSFIESSWRLKGDSSLIVRSLADTIRSYGGEIICRSEVVELVEKGGKLVQAVCSDGRVYEGNVFVSDVHPAVTCGWVKRSERIKKVFRSRIGRLENTFGMCTVSLCIKPHALRYFNWNHYVYSRPGVWTFYQEAEAVGGVLVSCRVPEDGSGYARQVDLLTPMNWGQCERWTDTVVGHRGEEYLRLKERMADECIALADEVIPGLRDMVEGCYVSTPLTFRDYTSVPEGSAYGVRKDFNAPLMTMLSPRTPVPNLLLTGQHLLLHGLHGVTMTALLTCAEIIGREELRKLVFRS